MILVDTSVWIDHLHRGESHLDDLIELADAMAHRLVIEEVAMGSIKDRAHVLGQMENLRGGDDLTHDEVIGFVEARRLWGRGLSPVDAQLLGAAVLAEGALRIWTRDRALKKAAQELGVGYDHD